MQASVVALVAALGGIVLERTAGSIPFFRIIGDALIMGAFIIAATSFLLFMKRQLTGTNDDELMWAGQH